MSPDDEERSYRARFERERKALDHLRAQEIKGVERARIEALYGLMEKGFDKVLSRRGAEGRREISALARDFVAHGPKAIFSAGVQRGGDFLLNQLRGRWAEDVVASLAMEELRIVHFGPSQAAMPGDESHLDIVRTFREILLLEGKRPDLLAFDARTWDALPVESRACSKEWPERRLEARDLEMVKSCACGLEVKNSLWHYGDRRASTGRPLSITVKEEELSDFNAWSAKTGRPVVFVQVLFDELYCMSFVRMRESISRGFSYEPSDYEFVREPQTGKLTHKFHLTGTEHLLGKVRFPSESQARVRVLEEGSVIPYIVFSPAAATDVRPEVMLREISYRGST